MTLGPHDVRIVATRASTTEVDESGVLLPGCPLEDDWQLWIGGELASAGCGLTVATYTQHPQGAPIWHPGLYRSAVAPGLHRGEPALRFEGVTPPGYVRALTGRLHRDWEAELVIHDLEGPGRRGSWGCPTAVQAWLTATIERLGDLAQSGRWEAVRHPDGRWLCDVDLREGE